MAESQNNTGLKVKGPFGIDLAATGPVTIIVIALIAIALVIVWGAREITKAVQSENKAVATAVRYENERVGKLIESLDCRVQFAIWMGRIPRDQPIDWHNLPGNLYDCIPPALTGRQK